MKETTIAFTTFFMLIFLVILIRVGRRLKRRQKINGKIPNLILFSKIRRSKTADFDCDCGGGDCGGDCGGGDCDCGGGDCDCGDCDCGSGSSSDCSGCDCSSSSSDCSGCGDCLYLCGGVGYTGCGQGSCSQPDRSRRTRTTKEEQKQRFEEKTIKDEQYYQKQIEQMELVRANRVEELRESGYILDEKDVAKVFKLISAKAKTGLIWVSTVTKLPIEVIMLIIEKEPNFEVKDEYIVNRQMMQTDKTKTEYEWVEERLAIRKLALEGNCPECGNPYKVGPTPNVYCKNCGASIEISKEPITSITEEQEDMQIPYRVDSPEIVEKPKKMYSQITYFALLFGLVSIVVYLIPVELVTIQIIVSVIAIIFGICGIILKNKKGIAITGLIAGIISLALWLLLILDVFYVWDYF